MASFKQSIFAAGLLAGAALAGSGAQAAEFLFNTNTGRPKVDFVAATKINGVAVRDGGVIGNGAYGFMVQGDFRLNSNGTTIAAATGSSQLSAPAAVATCSSTPSLGTARPISRQSRKRPRRVRGASAFGLLPQNILPQNPLMMSALALSVPNIPLFSGTTGGGLPGTSSTEERAAGAPSGARALRDLRIYGPGDVGNEYEGFDDLLLAGLGGTPLVDPMLNGVPLQSVSWSDLPEFGGDGLGNLIGAVNRAPPSVAGRGRGCGLRPKSPPARCGRA